MLDVVLDERVCSTADLPVGWTVDVVLDLAAKARRGRIHALIDTGALVTGLRNREVASKLLERGLGWCDGVVYLDDDDKKQVLLRATGRSMPEEQCGVPLERRFAFYDQVHTTGMDMRHVANATALVTLGKDMVWRDYAQGVFRMRGVGRGQKIRVVVLPEVRRLLESEVGGVRRPAARPDDLLSSATPRPRPLATLVRASPVPSTTSPTTVIVSVATLTTTLAAVCAASSIMFPVLLLKPPPPPG